MDDSDKQEILKAVESFRNEVVNQNVLILGSLETLQNQSMNLHQRVLTLEEEFEKLKSTPPPPTVPEPPFRDRMPTLTTEEKREQAMTLTKSVSVQAESSRVIANTIRILPYVTALGMMLAALIAGFMQYYAQHPSQNIQQVSPVQNH